MERRKAIRVAGAASLTLVAGAAGIALNSGIVGDNRDSDVGQVMVVSQAPYTGVDEYGRRLGEGSLLEEERPPKITASKSQALTVSSGSEVSDKDDHHDDDDDHDKSEHDDDHDDDHDHDHDKKHYDGADDDD